MAKFTPEDVVRRYKETGIRPSTGSMNLIERDGRWAQHREELGCCALGVIALGQPARRDVDDRKWDDGLCVAHHLGVSFAAFTGGFDCADQDSVLMEDEDWKLGVACRQAVEAEFGPVKRFFDP